MGMENNKRGSMRHWLAVMWQIAKDAFGHFNSDDGWAIASHLAVSAIIALFPFLIFAASLASFLGAEAFSDTAVHIVFDTWPREVAEPLAQEVVSVLSVRRGDVLTFGVLFAAFFASNGVEALRLSLNRAYRVREERSFLFLRAQSLVFVLVAAAGFFAISLLLVIAPVVANFANERVEWLELYMGTITFWRYVVAVVVLVSALLAVHWWLPAGHRRFVDILPGIVFTLAGWLVGSSIFAAYLARFSSYVNTYAGLASMMIAVVFLYIISAIFIIGGELNAAIMRYRDAGRTARD